MMNSIKYRIPSVIVKTAEEALADKRKLLQDKVLNDPNLPDDQKVALFESAVAKRLNDENKLNRGYTLDPPEEPLPTDLEPEQVKKKKRRVSIKPKVVRMPGKRVAIRTKAVKKVGRRGAPGQAKQKGSGGRGAIVYPSSFNVSEHGAFGPFSLKSFDQRGDKTTPNRKRNNANHLSGKTRLRIVRW